jgi:tRNA(fMet)-specific endonuclease VapC
MRYLLDTNTCIAAMRNHPKVMQRMSAASPGDCAISTITTYELFTGVEKSANPVKESAKVQLLIQTLQEVEFDASAAKEAARVRALLESQGQPIGPYDTLLAAQALAMSVVLVSANVKEFSRVSGLTTENWEV